MLSLHRVLAGGTVGAGPLSHRVAAIAALSPSGHRCPRSTGLGLGRSNAPCTFAQRSFSSVPNLRRYRVALGSAGGAPAPHKCLSIWVRLDISAEIANFVDPHRARLFRPQIRGRLQGRF